MKRNQYFALSWFFLVLMFLFIGIHTIMWQSNLYYLSADLTSGTMYVTIKYAFFSVMIYLSFPLFVLFQILGRLEPKKNMEDDAPKEHKEIVKLARLEHEVKELKNKLKTEGKIRN